MCAWAHYNSCYFSGFYRTDRVTHSDGDVGRLNNGGADVVVVTILKCYHWLANNILGLALRIQGCNLVAQQENKRLKFIDMLMLECPAPCLDLSDDEKRKAGIVKFCSPNMLGDLNVSLKDLSDTIPGTMHHKVIVEGGYGKYITVSAAMILKNVCVFTLKPSKHYLNITIRNVVEVFRKDTVPGSGSG
uniref:Homologous recombination OB-fold protein OB-fold domain-containing protein n=1 Tax=Tanacetum cinerariifolium TaxID=118510 RepID=A0A6L2P2P7_TANCI|nr:hypothetical protein [Tanacetum cinerariifolium]